MLLAPKQVQIKHELPRTTYTAHLFQISSTDALQPRCIRTKCSYLEEASLTAPPMKQLSSHPRTLPSFLLPSFLIPPAPVLSKLGQCILTCGSTLCRILWHFCDTPGPAHGTCALRIVPWEWFLSSVEPLKRNVRISWMSTPCCGRQEWKCGQLPWACCCLGPMQRPSVLSCRRRHNLMWKIFPCFN